MKTLITFENWKNNIIDDNLFSSGRAKYDPHVINGVINYKTGNSEPYYFATITKKGDKFICKIYKRKRNGDEKRIRNRVQESLKIAHNYVREFLNQRLKKDKEKGKTKDDEIIRSPEPEIKKQDFLEPPPMEITPPIDVPRSRAVIRRF